MYGIMVLVRFIAVFVWEAFALWSHLLQRITHPLECIMEMKFLLLLCFFFPRSNFFFFFFFLLVLCYYVFYLFIYFFVHR